jgi:hypothetical protein
MAVVAADDLIAKGLMYGSCIEIISIGRHPPEQVIKDIDGLFEKAADCLKVWFLIQQRINQVVITIDGSER